MNRPRNRRAVILGKAIGRTSLALAALGVIGAPAPVPIPNAPASASQQGNDTGKQAPVTTQAPQAKVVEQHYAKLGAHTLHPVWLGRQKRGAGRKNGSRSKWDYRR